MTCTLGDPEEATHANGWRVIRRPCGVPSLAGAPKLLRRKLYKVATRPLVGWFLSLAYLCDRVHMFDPRPLRIAIQALGGPAAASRRLGCSDALVHHWLTGRRPISAEMALRLRDAMIALSGTLPGVAHDLKVAAQEAEMRQMRWRARRPSGNRREATSHRSRRWNGANAGGRSVEIARWVEAGEPLPWRRNRAFSRA